MTGPAAPVRDPLIWPALRELRKSIAGQLALVGRPVVTFPLTWGTERPPADACTCTDREGAHGMAWGRWAVSTPFPDAARAQTQCVNGLWHVTLEFGVYRCYPGLDVNGNPPSEFAVDKATAGLLDDAAAIRRGVWCSEWLERRDVTWSWLSEVPITPSGDCAGVALQVRVQRGECKC